MVMKNCPICNRRYVLPEEKYRFTHKLCEYKYKDGYYKITCFEFERDVYIHTSIIDTPNRVVLIKCLNLLYEFLLHNGNIYTSKEKATEWRFYYDKNNNENSYGPEYINVYKFINNYPEKVLDIALRSLVNYSILYPSFGEEIKPFDVNNRVCFQNGTWDDNFAGVLKMLTQMGYMTKDINGDYFTISAEGWKKIEELNRDEQVLKQGFIAMSFNPETQNIREAFRKGITEAGYSVAIIDEKEHNNQIVPEIFFEIERSKFAVVDVTYPNYGAYYEAGYAQALGKQVIICCRKKEFDGDKTTRPHFDISQRSMIVWENEEDLVARLKRRIEATVK